MLLAMASALPAVTGATQDATDAPPNILLVVTDDQRPDTLQYMPIVNEQLVDQGVTFVNAFVETPVCCPSRASILTGKYTHNHDIWHNTLPEGGAEKFKDNGGDQSTIASWLQEAGYTTGLVGKYMNEYRAISPYIPPGWDDWFVHSRRFQYYDYIMNDNGEDVSYGIDSEDYSTDVFADRAVSFIENADAPFFLYFAPHTPHSEQGGPAKVADRHIGTCDEMTFDRPPSFNEEDMSDKPRWMKQYASLTDEEIASIETLQRDTVCSLKAVDEAVGAMVDALGDEIDNTVIIFTSDNGLAWGEHRYTTKNCLYEECIRVPLVMRAPMFTDTVRTDDNLVLNVDLPITIAEMAGASIPDDVNGESLVPLLDSTDADFRDAILIEYFNNRIDTYDAAVRTKEYKYGLIGTGEEEF